MHRPKTSNRLPFPACVARPVGKKELMREKKAIEAMKAEWKRLWDKKVWDASTVAEWSDVAREARRRGEEIHMGRLFGLCVEKGAELK